MELEITSDCNAACPGCARTQNLHRLEVTRFSLDDLKRILPDERHIRDKDISLCGVLGDPMIHPQVVDITEYLLSNGAQVTISTNAGIAPIETWEKLGKLSGIYGRNFILMACIDGHRETNHIYRVNTKFDVIERNLNAFNKYAYKGPLNKNRWVFIVFDHNEHEIEAAKEHAKMLGFQFYIRTGMRNSINTWIAKLGKKNNIQEKKITTTGHKEHKRKSEVIELDKIIAEKKVDKAVLDTLVCKFVHDGELFINAQQEMWPCCYLWDSMFWGKEDIANKYAEFGKGWNSLKDKSIEEIMIHPYYTKVLADSWNPEHNKHMKRCIRTCAKNKAYQNVMVEQK
jgi:MoaA/NifB/PqqE/SkfB family radical SAM enzyme